MTEKELKEQLISAGVSQEQLSKVDFPKFEAVFDSADNIDDLCQKMKKLYPDFVEEDFRQLVAEQSEDSENVVDLSEEALEAVAGGSKSSWLKNNKDWLIPLGLIAAAGLTYMLKKTIDYRRDMNWVKSKSKVPVLKIEI